MPTQFDNVTVFVAANVYFDGKVTSRKLRFADGSEKTLGVMLPGEYEFGTGKPELMEITRGRLDVLLPGEGDWRTIVGGESFHVAGDARFQLRVHELTDYVCSFLDA
jgi:uncharacterized protein YaiE (UPF0345 family)